MLSKIIRKTIEFPLLRINRRKPPGIGRFNDQMVPEYKMKRSTYLNIALGCFIFSLCFATLPLYRLFCEHTGLVGDTNKKTYEFKDRVCSPHRKFTVKFNSTSEPGVNWQFQPVEKELIIGASETAIMFYKLRNYEEKPIVGFATYNVHPEDVNVYFSKIQCFCFNQQMVNPQQELLLPLFFYLEPEINDDQVLREVKEINLTYNFIKSSNQNLAKFAEEELKRIEQNKQKLNTIRAGKMNMSLEEYEDHLAYQEQLEAQENNRVQQQLMRKERQLEYEQQKKDKRLQEDLIKARMISDQFKVDNMFTKKTSSVI